jgi:NAD(P)-dependent dehydrogenase (short-subunit alcohol dehydrogenase family)
VQNVQLENNIFKGRVAVVTGASRGIGRAIAVELARSGADIAIVSRSCQTLEETKNLVEAAGVRCFMVSCDICELAKLESFLKETAKKLGVPGILINNAGIYSTGPVLNHPLAEWEKVLSTNLSAAMWATRCVLADMIKLGWGRIVNISSISGKSGEPYGAAYSASKFGMLGLTQSVALEVARDGITVNAVCPGWVQTEMAQRQLTDDRWCDLNEIPKEESLEIARLSVPQQRFIEPQEVAALVRFLCSDEAKGITGQAINICGGLSLH